MPSSCDVCCKEDTFAEKSPCYEDQQPHEVFQTEKGDEELGDVSELPDRFTCSWPSIHHSSIRFQVPQKTSSVESEDPTKVSKKWKVSLAWVRRQAREVSGRGFRANRCMLVASYLCLCLVIPFLFGTTMILKFTCAKGSSWLHAWTFWCWIGILVLAWSLSFRVLLTADTLYQHYCFRMVLLFLFAGCLENTSIMANCDGNQQVVCEFFEGVPCSLLSCATCFLYWSAVHMLMWMIMLRVVRLEEVMHRNVFSGVIIKMLLCCIPLGYLCALLWCIWEFRWWMDGRNILISMLLRVSLYFTGSLIFILGSAMIHSISTPAVKLSVALCQGKIQWSSEVKSAFQSLLGHIIMCNLLLLSGLSVLIGLCIYVVEDGTATVWVLIPHMVDTLSNTVGMYIFSGARWARSEESSTEKVTCPLKRLTTCATYARSLSRAEVADWQWTACVEELSSRAICLRDLLDFYKSLPGALPHFDSKLHSTNDIVWQRIIPRTSSKGCSYSSLMTEKQLQPTMMVTHNWANRFRDLCAAIVADALGQDEYSTVAGLLDSNPSKLEEALQLERKLKETYWVCCFSVNQHRSICNFPGGPRPDPVTKRTPGLCGCKRQKYLNHTPPLDVLGRSCLCEMNKFDDMMLHVAKQNPLHRHVVAVDSSFAVFERAWCVSEIYTANDIGLHQHLVIRSRDDLIENETLLRHLRIENMQASRQEDVEEILRKIEDIDGFNGKFQKLLFDPREGLLSCWLQLDGVQQMERIGRLLRWVV